jgi:hypothetical protein
MSQVDVAAIRSRHAEFFAVNWRRRLTIAAILVAMAAIYIGAFAWFDVP